MIFSALYDGQEIVLDLNEVMDGKFIAASDLEDWMSKSPEEFSDGFKTAYQKYKDTF